MFLREFLRNYTTGFFTSYLKCCMMALNEGHGPMRREEFRMDRYTVTMRHKHLEFLLCSFKQELRFALRCPEKMHGRDLKHQEE